MEIVVCIKRVPDVADVDVSIAGDGRSIVETDLDFGINEWDNFAIEEAIRLRDEHGGRVTALSIGGEEVEDELRRALAMGVDEALRIDDEGIGDLDAFGAATILQALLADRPFDLILTGAVASDTGSGQVGGMLAALLDAPQVALATMVSVDGGKVTAQHEVEGGMERVVELDLPAVISVQTGLNEPRYVSIRGIRRVSGTEIPVVSASTLVGAVPVTRVRLAALLSPPAGKSGEILEGDTSQAVDVLVERLRENGGI